MKEKMRGGESVMGGPILLDMWCYTCDNKTIHQVQLMSEINFVGKLLVCTMCGETVREPMMGVTGVLERTT